ncbi:MAG: CoA-binding protein [Hymenobacteraceae bacterium]|nr:CoA-binding protein [Hymenobacteraceae bacterium]
MIASPTSASKKTVVIGASPNPARYAYVATQRLRRAGHEVVAVGLRPGQVGDVELRTDRPAVPDVDTVTLYVGPQHQPAWHAYILGLRPKRIIFNPGTENEELDQAARAQGIETEEACTLVMLASGTY